MGATGCLRPVLSSLSRATENDCIESGFESRVVEGLKRTKHGLQAASGTHFLPLKFIKPMSPRPPRRGPDDVGISGCFK